MIVDDNEKMRRMIAVLMSHEQNEFFECANGAEAGAAYRSFWPDWVLMDLEMPVLDGIDATRLIVAFDPSAKIVVVTNHDAPEMRAAAIEAGAVGFVAKRNLIELRTIVREKN